MIHKLTKFIETFSDFFKFDGHFVKFFILFEIFDFYYYLGHLVFEKFHGILAIFTFWIQCNQVFKTPFRFNAKKLWRLFCLEDRVADIFCGIAHKQIKSIRVDLEILLLVSF